MGRHSTTWPLFASAKTAAAILDMPQTEFRQLVEAGALPKGKEIAPGHIRWDVETLRQIINGRAIDEGISW